jgi:hypothetical protein
VYDVRRWTQVAVTALAIASIAALMPGSARAHAPGVTLSGSGSATIDGALSAGEWTGAGTIDFTVNLPDRGTTTGTLYAMNDASDLYLAVRFARVLAVNEVSSVAFEFDNDHDGRGFEKGDDAIVFSPGGTNEFFDDFRIRCRTASSAPFHTWCAEEDTEAVPPPGVSIPGLPPAGTTDGQSAFVNDGSFSVYELSHPLDSADDAHDFSLGAGDSVGFTLFVRVIAGELVDTFFPTVPADGFASGYGDVVIASP